MSAPRDCAVTVTARERAELLPAEREARPPAADEVAGRTLRTLVSAGTEVAGVYAAERAKPTGLGYAAVFEVEAVGAEVKDLQPGDLAFAMGPHRSWQRARRNAVVPLPAGLAAEAACFTRMLCVSCTTLVTTAARPPDPVLVTGLGPVGNMAAQLFTLAGYEVLAADPVAERRRLAELCGVRRTFAAAPVEDPCWAGKVALVVECSGHEAAVLAGCRMVRRRGEVVLVGVPWAKKTDIPAFEVLHAVFHKYAVLRSGWEWELPTQADDFRARSIVGNLEAGLGWLAAGRIRTEGLYQVLPPGRCQEAYQDILHNRSPKLVTIFDWTERA